LFKLNTKLNTNISPTLDGQLLYMSQDDSASIHPARRPEGKEASKEGIIEL